MATKYAAQLSRAQQRIKARGGRILYTSVVGSIVPNDPAFPFLVGTPPIGGPDPNADATPVSTYAVFVDAKARGSSTQGMAAELVKPTDVPAGNKTALIAGFGVACKIGDKIDRNVDGVSGYPVYKVCKIKSVDIDGTVIMWTLELEL